MRQLVRDEQLEVVVEVVELVERAGRSAEAVDEGVRDRAGVAVGEVRLVIERQVDAPAGKPVEVAGQEAEAALRDERGVRGEEALVLVEVDVEVRGVERVPLDVG